MSRGKSSISKASSYKEIGEFWDTHDLGDYWEQTQPVEFEVDIQSEAIYFSNEHDPNTQPHPGYRDRSP